MANASSPTAAINAYVSFRSYLVTVHGVVGASKATGAALPRLTYADRWLLGALFLGITTTALKQQVRDAAYNLPFEEAEHAGTIGSELHPHLAIDRTHGTLVTGKGELRMRPLGVWVGGKPAKGMPLQRTPHGESFPWYVWPLPGGPRDGLGSLDLDDLAASPSRHAAVETIMGVWDPVWSHVLAPKQSTSIYLTLDETEALFSALYKLIITIPATFLRFTVGGAAESWDQVKRGAKAVVGAGAEAASDAIEFGAEQLAKGANFAGETLGDAFANFIGSIGFYGLALVVGLIVAHKYGVL